VCDAISGALLFHFGMQLFDFYTVMFGVARVIGFSAQAILGRGLQAPIIRPKSVTNEWVLNVLQNKK
jgi:citrate synthase